MAKDKIIGSGFAFPMDIDAQGGAAMSWDEENIRQSMMLIAVFPMLAFRTGHS